MSEPFAVEAKVKILDVPSVSLRFVGHVGTVQEAIGPYRLVRCRDSYPRWFSVDQIEVADASEQPAVILRIE